MSQSEVATWLRSDPALTRDCDPELAATEIASVRRHYTSIGAARWGLQIIGRSSTPMLRPVDLITMAMMSLRSEARIDMAPLGLVQVASYGFNLARIIPEEGSSPSQDIGRRISMFIRVHRDFFELNSRLAVVMFRGGRHD